MVRLSGQHFKIPYAYEYGRTEEQPPSGPPRAVGVGRVLGAEDITRTLRCCSALSRLEPTRLQWCCRWRAPEIGPLDP